MFSVILFARVRIFSDFFHLPLPWFFSGFLLHIIMDENICISTSKRDKETDGRKRHRTRDIPYAVNTEEMSSYLQFESPQRTWSSKKSRSHNNSNRDEFRTISVSSHHHETMAWRKLLVHSSRPSSPLPIKKQRPPSRDRSPAPPADSAAAGPSLHAPYSEPGGSQREGLPVGGRDSGLSSKHCTQPQPPLDSFPQPMGPPPPLPSVPASVGLQHPIGQFYQSIRVQLDHGHRASSEFFIFR